MRAELAILTECALLTAVAVILDLSSLVPVLGQFTVPLCSLPSLYIAFLHGARNSLLSAAAAAVILSLSCGPQEGFAYLSLFAVTGISLGLLARRGCSAMEIIGGSTVLVSLSMVFDIYVAERVMGLPEDQSLSASFRSGIMWMADCFAGAAHAVGLSTGSSHSPGLESFLDVFLYAPVALVAGLSFIVVYTNYLAAALVLSRFDLPWEPIPDARALRSPRWVSLCAVLSLLLALSGYTFTEGPVGVAAANILFLSWLVLLMSAFSLVTAFLDIYGLRNPIFRLALVFVLLVPMLPLTLLAALADSFMDFRGRFGFRPFHAH